VTPWGALGVQALTVRHEVAHALAYIACGLDFVALDLRNWITTVRPGRYIHGFTAAQIAAAGMAVEVAAMADQEASVSDAIDRAIGAWHETAEDVAAWPEDADEWSGSDLASTHGLLAVALPWAWAFVQTNRDLIEELGARFEEEPEVSYRTFMRALGARRPAGDGRAVSEAYNVLFGGVTADRLAVVDSLVRQIEGGATGTI